MTVHQVTKTLSRFEWSALKGTDMYLTPIKGEKRNAGAQHMQTTQRLMPSRADYYTSHQWTERIEIVYILRGVENSIQQFTYLFFTIARTDISRSQIVFPA